MSTKYGLALAASSLQNILPVITQDGLVKGWYPITGTTFTGSETTFALSDVTVPISTVTVDEAPRGTSTPSVVLPRTFQYMAAVYPQGLAANYQPWASANFIPASWNMGGAWSMPSMPGALLREGMSVLAIALKDQIMNVPGASAPAAPSAPSVTTPKAMTWNSSMAYALINGSCSFFDFNWVTLFATSQQEITPLSISVTSLPGNVTAGQPFAASILGVPVATNNGPVYDTIRIVRLLDAGLIPTGTYAFVFSVLGVGGTTASVTLNLTIS